MNKLVFATHNTHKRDELNDLLPAGITLLHLGDVNYHTPIPETADTLAGNALIKARTVFQATQITTFADDTGLEVDALNGAPGVYSARYAGEEGNAEANMNKLLHALHGNTNRKAQFRTVIALVSAEGEWLFEGRVEGQIATARNGAGGFGYDPIFIPEGHHQSFAEMTKEQKNAISHRGRAVAALLEFLRNQ